MAEHNIISDAEQIQLQNMGASAVELWARGKELPCTALVLQLVLMIQSLKAQHVPLIYSRQVNFVMFSFKTAIWKKLKWPKRVNITPDKFCN